MEVVVLICISQSIFELGAGGGGRVLTRLLFRIPQKLNLFLDPHGYQNPWIVKLGEQNLFCVLIMNSA